MKDLQLFRLIITVAGKLRQRGSWTGETHLQKVGYFLQHLMGVPLEAEYILYKHGPYSFDLRRTLAAMRAYQYVEWQPNPYPYGPTLIEGPLAGTLKRFTREPAEYSAQIAFAAQWLGPKRVSELERLGTAQPGVVVLLAAHRGERIAHPQLVVTRCSGGERVLSFQVVG